jgi:three-Cys-motif partner protein
MTNFESFFSKQTEASKIKADIVSRYFSGWANVMASQGSGKIAYLDLFSGPGRYNDGNFSTPLLIVEKAINNKNKKVCDKIVFMFNDADPRNVAKLKYEIANYPGIDKLKFEPSISNFMINEKIVTDFGSTTKIPTLSFIDPWGYKGLSLLLIQTLVKNWGCDCIFFFNYRRINPGIENPTLQEPISLLLTENVLNELRLAVVEKDPREREAIILGKVRDVLREWGMDYVLTFPFKDNKGKRTTHYLVFVTKHVLGYNIMKDIMGSASSYHLQGVPSFEYNPGDVDQLQFDFEKPLDDLKKMLLNEFSGITISMEQIYKKHNVNKPYLSQNYKMALLDLERQEKIKTNRIEIRARAGQCPDRMLIAFP